MWGACRRSDTIYMRVNGHTGSCWQVGLTPDSCLRSCFVVLCWSLRVGPAMVCRLLLGGLVW